MCSGMNSVRPALAALLVALWVPAAAWAAPMDETETAEPSIGLTESATRAGPFSFPSLQQGGLPLPDIEAVPEPEPLEPVQLDLAPGILELAAREPWSEAPGLKRVPPGPFTRLAEWIPEPMPALLLDLLILGVVVRWAMAGNHHGRIRSLLFRRGRRRRRRLA